MKTFVFALPSLLVLSCSTPTENKEEITNEMTQCSINAIVEDEAEINVEEDRNEKEFDYSELPQKWWLLTKKGDELIRYNHWDAQDETIEFVIGKNGTDWMNIAYAHDSDQGDITEFSAISYVDKEISRVDGSFIFHSKLEGTSTKINFYWNLDEHYMEFENLSDERLYYVDDESRGYFLYEETFREED